MPGEHRQHDAPSCSRRRNGSPRDGISARVESFHTVKPLDERTLERAVRRATRWSRSPRSTAASAAWAAASPSGCARAGISPRARLLAFGTDDAFMHEVGSQEYARRKFGLTAENIAAKVLAKLRAARHRRGAAALRHARRHRLRQHHRRLRRAVPSGSGRAGPRAGGTVRYQGRGARLPALDRPRGRRGPSCRATSTGRAWAKRRHSRACSTSSAGRASSRCELAIVSHRTRHPFIGPKHDLHEAARGWVDTFLRRPGLIDRDGVFFELTKEEKLARIGAVGCTHFVDDLPESCLAERSHGPLRRSCSTPSATTTRGSTARARQLGRAAASFRKPMGAHALTGEIAALLASGRTPRRGPDPRAVRGGRQQPRISRPRWRSAVDRQVVLQPSFGHPRPAAHGVLVSLVRGTPRPGLRSSSSRRARRARTSRSTSTSTAASSPPQRWARTRSRQRSRSFLR